MFGSFPAYVMFRLLRKLILILQQLYLPTNPLLSEEAWFVDLCWFLLAWLRSSQLILQDPPG
jgi:hypothetical protein